MRRVPLILGLALIAGLIIHDVYDFFVTDEGIRYFSSDPRRLLYVVLLGAAGGIVAFGISRLSPVSQRKLKLTAVGGFGILLVSALAFFGYLFYLLAMSGLKDALRWVWISLAMAFIPMAMVTAMVWLEFRRVVISHMGSARASACWTRRPAASNKDAQMAE